MDKVENAQQIEEELQRLTKAHLQSWSPVLRPVAAVFSVPSIRDLLKQMKKLELRTIPIYQVRARRKLKSDIEIRAALRRTQLEAEAKFDQAKRQGELDEDWERLFENDREAVRQQLTWYFGDNEAKCAVLDVQAARATVLVIAPPKSVLPEHDWSYTEAGNLSVRKMKATDRNEYYFDLIFSQLIATLMEGFAVCPSLEEMTLVLATLDQNKITETHNLECIGAGTAFKLRLQGVDLLQEPFEILKQSVDYWLMNPGPKLNMKPLDLKSEPDINRLLSEISRS